MTDTELAALLAQVDAIESEPDGGNTWWDHDPDVAWNEPESLHGRLRALYLEAGWEPCYHRDAKFHYNVKLNGFAHWQAFRHKVDAAISDNRAYDRIAEVSDSITESELEQWWENLPFDDISHIPGAIPFNGSFKVWSCGRSGGYLNASDVEDKPRIMLQLAFIAGQARDYYNSAEWGEYLAEMALEADQDRQMASLASARPDRVEA